MRFRPGRRGQVKLPADRFRARDLRGNRHDPILFASVVSDAAWASSVFTWPCHVATCPCICVIAADVDPDAADELDVLEPAGVLAVLAVDAVDAAVVVDPDWAEVVLFVEAVFPTSA